MALNQPQEYRAKIINMGGTVRGWIPSPLVALMGGRDGDYMIFHIDKLGKVEVNIRRPTASERKKAAIRKTKET